MTTCTNTAYLVDDSEIDLFIGKKILEHNHFAKDIMAINSPLKVLDMLRAGTDLPEVIFLDLNMPIIDGFQFIREFSHLPAFIQENVSIIVLTSSENNQDRTLVEEQKLVKGFISKPLTDEKVEQLKREFVLTKSLLD